MFKSLIVKGKSSGHNIKTFTDKELTLLNSEKPISLMDYLRRFNIPVASSCYGEGVCRKCLINDSILSCQITPQEFIQNYDMIVIDYL